MAIGSPVTLGQVSDRGPSVFPVGFSSPWKTVIDAGSTNGYANGTPFVTNPCRPDNDPNMLLSGHHALNHQLWEGNTLVTRAFYDATNTVVGGGKFSVWGRFNPNPILNTGAFDTAITVTDYWIRLKNKANNGTRTPPYDMTNDASDGTLKYTSVDVNEDVWDTLGCNEFRFAVESVPTATTGSAALAGLQVKGI